MHRARTPSPRLRAEEDDIPAEAPVMLVPRERRMQQRARTLWRSLRRGADLPLIADLRLESFGQHAMLLDCADGTPRIAYLGEALAAECGVSAAITDLAQAPAASLLGEATRDLPRVIARAAPAGFETEVTNARGAGLVCRGTLLPFAEVPGGPVRHVLVVVSWKELADEALSADLAQQMAMAMEAVAALGGLPAIAPGEQDAAARLPAAHLPAAAPMPSPAAPLADWLASARDLAQAADGSRQSLYDAIGRTHDLALEAARQPRALAALLAGAGLAPQSRAPLLPLVKLVFGADYDKTRLTEYATALAHADRLGLGRGELARHLARVSGGLKGVLAEERRLRSAEARKHRRPAPAEALTLCLARRLPDGSLQPLREVADSTLLALALQN